MPSPNEQAELLMSLGMLVGPIMNVADNIDKYDASEKSRVRARFASDLGAFLSEVKRYTTGDSGHDFRVERARINEPLLDLRNRLQLDSSDSGKFIRQIVDQVKSGIVSLPITFESAFHLSTTPFATYSLLRSVCSAAQREVIWMDRYFDRTVFHRFLCDVSPTAGITLITRKDAGPRQGEFLDISRLFAQERGPNAYRLVFNDSFHDRVLRCDDTMLSLGGSIKELGIATTFVISQLDDTKDNRAQFIEAINGGVEVYGPTQQKHP